MRECKMKNKKNKIIQESIDHWKRNVEILESFDEDMKRKVEAGVNEILDKNLDVEIRFMPRADAISFLKERDYQTRYLEMVPESVQDFRVLIIGDYDVASCAGTHVENTGEIGHIQIGKSKNYIIQIQRVVKKAQLRGILDLKPIDPIRKLRRPSPKRTLINQKRSEP